MVSDRLHTSIVEAKGCTPVLFNFGFQSRDLKAGCPGICIQEFYLGSAGCLQVSCLSVMDRAKCTEIY